MIEIQDVSRSLLERAEELRPAGRSSSAPVVRIAKDLGIDVRLVLRPLDDRRRFDARCELGARPQIVIYRHSASAAVADVSPAEEHFLSKRERFSVAHELGHCIAYNSFGLRPVLMEDNRAEYWRQEKVMNEFASAVLVPPWLSCRWRGQLPALDAACVFKIREWSNDCRASPEVVTTAFARHNGRIGFLKVKEAVKVRTKKRLLIVAHSAAGVDVGLPKMHSHVEDDGFVSSITGRSGVADSSHFQIGQFKLNNVNLAWWATDDNLQSRRREFRSTIRLSGAGYWIGVSTAGNSDGEEQNGLLL